MVPASVDEDEDDEAAEEDELVRCRFFLGMKMRDTSSVLMLFKLPWAPLPVCHADRGTGWKLGGGATAVICERRAVCRT